ncbi:translation initiation factor IF-2-like [Neovison vison]|uniref:translation initiation factor IF-2-like n=1 Tax=Neovison vison TaxID=452646 RepID=UPI001CF023A8|nr:translation initiation factor IF-2-like [Neogale vison]
MAPGRKSRHFRLRRLPRSHGERAPGRKSPHFRLRRRLPRSHGERAPGRKSPHFRLRRRSYRPLSGPGAGWSLGTARARESGGGPASPVRSGRVCPRPESRLTAWREGDFRACAAERASGLGAPRGRAVGAGLGSRTPCESGLCGAALRDRGPGLEDAREQAVGSCGTAPRTRAQPGAAEAFGGASGEVPAGFTASGGTLRAPQSGVRASGAPRSGSRGRSPAPRCGGGGGVESARTGTCRDRGPVLADERPRAPRAAGRAEAVQSALGREPAFGPGGSGVKRTFQSALIPLFPPRPTWGPPRAPGYRLSEPGAAGPGLRDRLAEPMPRWRPDCPGESRGRAAWPGVRRGFLGGVPGGNLEDRGRRLAARWGRAGCLREPPPQPRTPFLPQPDSLLMPRGRWLPTSVFVLGGEGRSPWGGGQTWGPGASQLGILVWFRR